MLSWLFLCVWDPVHLGRTKKRKKKVLPGELARLHVVPKQASSLLLLFLGAKTKPYSVDDYTTNEFVGFLVDDIYPMHL